MPLDSSKTSMKRIVATVRRVWGLSEAQPGASPSRCPVEEARRHARYRDVLAVFEAALVNSDLCTLDAAAAKLTRMQADLGTAAPAKGRIPGDLA